MENGDRPARDITFFGSFEQFKAGMRSAKLVEVRDGYVILDGLLFFNRSLKSRRRVYAFVDCVDVPCRMVVCLSERRRNFLCSAEETDEMGLLILHPDYMGFDSWPWRPIEYGDAEESPL